MRMKQQRLSACRCERPVLLLHQFLLILSYSMFLSLESETLIEIKGAKFYTHVDYAMEE